MSDEIRKIVNLLYEFCFDMIGKYGENSVTTELFEIIEEIKKGP